MLSTSRIPAPSLHLLALALLALTMGMRPAPAAPAAPSVRVVGGPVAGPIEVSADAHVLTTPLGSLLETTLVVENHGPDPVSVLLVGRIAWPAGSQQILRYGPPVTIGPNGALVTTALGPIPPDAGSGDGTFTATAFVGPIGQGGRGSYATRLIAQDGAAFVLP